MPASDTIKVLVKLRSRASSPRRESAPAPNTTLVLG
jgi:hypothetical protein